MWMLKLVAYEVKNLLVFEQLGQVDQLLSVEADILHPGQLLEYLYIIGSHSPELSLLLTSDLQPGGQRDLPVPPVLLAALRPQPGEVECDTGVVVEHSVVQSRGAPIVLHVDGLPAGERGQAASQPTDLSS